MVEFHKQNDNTAAGKLADNDFHPLLSSKDWSEFNNKMMTKDKPSVGESGVVEFNNIYKSDTKSAKPEIKSDEDNVRLKKKLRALENGGKDCEAKEEKKYVPNPAEGGKFDKPNVPADGGIKKPQSAGDGGIKDSIGKPNLPADGGIKELIKKPSVDGGIKDSVGKPNPAADGGLKDNGKPNHAADGGLKEPVGKPNPAFEGKPEPAVEGKPNPAVDAGSEANHNAEEHMHGGQTENSNPPADAGRDNPASTDRTEAEYRSNRDMSAVTGVRENFGNVTLASAGPLQQPWTVHGDGTVTRGTTRSEPVKS